MACSRTETWDGTEPGVLLEVPLDVCIVAPIGDDDDDDDDVIATNKTAFDIVKVFEKRNAYLPTFTKKLVQAKTSERREMGLALWLLWAIRAETKGMTCGESTVKIGYRKMRTSYLRCCWRERRKS